MYSNTPNSYFVTLPNGKNSPKIIRKRSFFTANLEEWVEIGRLSKKIRSDIQELRIKSQKVVSKKSSKQIDAALNAINEFKNQAEKDMFADGLGDINVFFGNAEVLSPTEMFLQEFEWSGRIGASELYDSYSTWSEQNGHEILTTTAFGKEVAKRYRKIKNNRNYYLSDEVEG